MSAIHPDLFRDYRQAKRAAAALAAAIPGCTLLQNAKGKPRVILGSRTQDYPTWLACYSFLFRLRCDQLAADKARKERERQQQYMDSLPWAAVVG